MSRRKWASVALLLTSIVLVVAVRGFTKAANPLDGTIWWLVRWDDKSLDPQAFELTAEFAHDQIGGKCGINSYGGTVHVGPGAKFSVGELFSTMIGVPQSDSRAGNTYLRLLHAARSYRLSEKALVLLDAAGKELLVFRCVNR